MKNILKNYNNKLEGDRIEVFLRSTASQSLEDDLEPASFSYELFQNAADNVLEAAIVYVEIPVLNAGVYDLKVNLVLDQQLVATRVIFSRYFSFCSLNLKGTLKSKKDPSGGYIQLLPNFKEINLQIFVNPKAKNYVENFSWFISAEVIKNTGFLRDRFLKDQYAHEYFSFPTKQTCVEFFFSSDKFHKISHTNAAVPEYVEFSFGIDRLLNNNELHSSLVIRLSLHAQTKSGINSDGTRFLFAAISLPFSLLDEKNTHDVLQCNESIALESHLFAPSQHTIKAFCSDGELDFFSTYPIVRYSPVLSDPLRSSPDNKIDFIMVLPLIENSRKELGAVFGCIMGPEHEVLQVFHFVPHRSTQHTGLVFVVESVVLQFHFGAEFEISYSFVHPDHMRSLTTLVPSQQLDWSTFKVVFESLPPHIRSSRLPIFSDASQNALDALVSEKIEHIFSSPYSQKTKLSLLLLVLNRPTFEAEDCSLNEAKSILIGLPNASAVTYSGIVFLTNLKLITSDYFYRINYSNYLQIFLDNLVDPSAINFSFKYLEVVAEIHPCFASENVGSSANASSLPFGNQSRLKIVLASSLFAKTACSSNPNKHRSFHDFVGTINGQNSICLRVGLFLGDLLESDEVAGILNNFFFLYRFNFLNESKSVINSVKTCAFFIFSSEDICVDNSINETLQSVNTVDKYFNSIGYFSYYADHKNKSSDPSSRKTFSLHLRAAVGNCNEFEERRRKYSEFLSKKTEPRKEKQ